jgi:hypothetical protein
MRAMWVEYGAAAVAMAAMSIAHAETITVTIDKIAYRARQAMGPDDIAEFNKERGAQACRQDRLLLQVSSQHDWRHFRRIVRWRLRFSPAGALLSGSVRQSGNSRCKADQF